MKKDNIKTIKVTQIGSAIGRNAKQKRTLVGLGLNKLHKTSELKNTPETQGMINQVKHLVKVESI